MKRIRHKILGIFCALSILLMGCSRDNTPAGGPPDPAVFAGQTDSTSAAPDDKTGPSSAMPEKNAEDAENKSDEKEETEMRMRVQVNGSTFFAVLKENEAVRTLVELMEQAPVTIAMSDYAGFEKVGPLGQSLPASNSQTTTQAGDIVLYNGDQIVIFYGSNSWSYTRLGHIEDLTGWEEALGGGDVTVTFSLGEQAAESRAGQPPYSGGF